MDRVLMEYVVNAAWQLPVLAAGAWLLVRVAKPSAAAQYRIWVGVLALAVVLPLMGAMTDAGARVEVHVAREATAPVASAKNEAAVSAGLVNASPVGMVTAGVDAAGDARGISARTISPNSDDSRVSGVRYGAAKPVLAKAEAISRSLRWTRRIEVGARAAEWVTGAYLLVMLLGLLRIARAWSAARRLVGDSDAEALTCDEQALVAECARRMSVREPEIRVVEDADALPGPVVVGARRPVMLCPEGFVRGLVAAGREDEARAALCHEMAHIKRRDYAANLLCEAMAAGLKWHPATYGVEQRIRGTREMACDAMAAQAMASDAEYARCLVGLAERMAVGGIVEQAGAMGLFNGNALEERVMRLMETEKTMSVRAKAVRGVVGVAAMAAAVIVAGMVHVVPARAQAVTATQVSPRPGAPVMATPSAKAAPIAAAPANPLVAAVKPRVQVRTQVHAVVRPPVAPVVSVAVPAVKTNVHVVTAVHVVNTPVKIAEVVKPVIAVHPVIAIAAPQVQVKPEANPEPAPKAKPAPKASPVPKVRKPNDHESIVSRNGKLYVWENGREHELSPAERARMEKDLEDVQKKIAAETARMNSPEFKEQLEKAQREAMDAQKNLNSAEMRRQMDQAKEQLAAAMAKMNSQEFKEQMEMAQREAMDAEKKIESGEIQRQMDQAKEQVAAAMAKMNSPEFKEQMEIAQLAAMDAEKKIQSGEIQRQMADAQKKLQKQLDELKAQDAKDGR